jgi:hypothetical protein
MYGHSSNAGMGGSSVTTEKFGTLDRCNRAKRAFLSMKVTPSELKVNGYQAKVTVARKAVCVPLGDNT